MTFRLWRCLIFWLGGWWYNDCTAAHLTGQNTKEKTTVDSVKQIFYFYGGERNSDSYDSWKEAEMMLVATGEYFYMIKLCTRIFVSKCFKIQTKRFFIKNISSHYQILGLNLDQNQIQGVRLLSATSLCSSLPS